MKSEADKDLDLFGWVFITIIFASMFFCGCVSKKTYLQYGEQCRNTGRIEGISSCDERINKLNSEKKFWFNLSKDLNYEMNSIAVVVVGTSTYTINEFVKSGQLCKIYEHIWILNSWNDNPYTCAICKKIRERKEVIVPRKEIDWEK